MQGRDVFDDLRLPRLLVNEHKQQGTGKEWDPAVISSRILKASIWAAAATAIGIAVLLIGNPMTFVTDIAASLLDKHEPNPDISIPAVQLVAGTQALPPSTGDLPARNQSSETGQKKLENLEPTSESLVRQFQAWAAGKDAQVKPVEQVQGGRTQRIENTQFRQFEAWAAEKDAQAHAGPREHIEALPAQFTEDVQMKEFDAWAAEKDAQALAAQDTKALVQRSSGTGNGKNTGSSTGATASACQAHPKCAGRNTDHAQ